MLAVQSPDLGTMLLLTAVCLLALLVMAGCLIRLLLLMALHR